RWRKRPWEVLDEGGDIWQAFADLTRYDAATAERALDGIAEEDIRSGPDPCRWLPSERLGAEAGSLDSVDSPGAARPGSTGCLTAVCGAGQGQVGAGRAHGSGQGSPGQRSSSDRSAGGGQADRGHRSNDLRAAPAG